MSQHTIDKHFPENIVGVNLDSVHKNQLFLLETSDILLKQLYVLMVYCIWDSRRPMDTLDYEYFIEFVLVCNLYNIIDYYCKINN